MISLKWAKAVNNYHPELKDISPRMVPTGCHPLRYQTKAYDESKKCLSIFTLDELEFLKNFRCLCHVPEFFKPEELFSELGNVEAAKQGEEMLRNFELDKDSVRCPDANTLNALIPYVKRLVRLFPHLKWKVKEKLSSFQIRNQVYQNETRRNVEKITQNELEFKPGALGLKDFLDSDRQFCQLRTTGRDVLTVLSEVFWVLQNISSNHTYSSEGHYTILEIERLLTLNRMTNLNALLAEMETPHLLMIAWGTDHTVNGELRDMFSELFNILKKKKTMKVFLTTQSDERTIRFLKQIASQTLGNELEVTKRKLTWNELTPDSQRKLLEKTVVFQSERVALNQLTSAEAMADCFPVSELLHEKELRIGEDLIPSGNIGYNEKYFIDRTFNQNTIRRDILSDKEEGKFTDLLASTELEFKQLCEKNPTINVHWLVEGESGEIICQQSKGDLKILSKYINGQKSKSYAPRDLHKLLQQAKNQRVMIIADKAGMGKSTVLTHLSKQIKQNFPAHWLVRIDINDYTELLKAQNGKKVDKEWVHEFISKEVLKLESRLEKELYMDIICLFSDPQKTHKYIV
jgi:hypothetical protein